MCVCVCVWQSVSLSSPSGVIKAGTNHPERSLPSSSIHPFPSLPPPPHSLALIQKKHQIYPHKTCAANRIAPAAAAQPIKLAYLVPIIPSCPPTSTTEPWMAAVHHGTGSEHNGRQHGSSGNIIMPSVHTHTHKHTHTQQKHHVSSAGATLPS